MSALVACRAPGRRALLGYVAALALVHCARKSGAPSAGVRIASLAPSLTETIFALDAGDQLVGRTRYCDYPEAAKRAPVVGGFGEVNWEALLAARPSLVFGTPSPSAPELARKLRERGIESAFLPAETIADVRASIAQVGLKIGKKAQADALLASIERELAALAARQLQTSRPRVAIVFGMSPLVLAGPASFAAELLELAGGLNALASGPAYANVPLEHLAALDPDVILDARFAEAFGPAEISSQPGWSALRAVKSNKFVRLRDEVVLRPGPRLAQAAAQYAAALGQ